MKRNDVKPYADSGMTLKQTAEELGVSYETVRHMANRQGVRFTPECYRTITDRAMDMKPNEAVDYLLGCLMDLYGSLCGDQHPVDEIIGKLSPTQRRIAIVLWDAGGKCVSLEQVYSACTFGTDNRPSHQTLKAHICLLRKRLPQGITIKNHWGRGYSMLTSSPSP